MNGEGLRGRKPHSARIRTRWISSGGMVADKEEECGVMQMEVLSYSCGGQHWHKRAVSEKGEAVTLQRQGRRR